MEDKRYLELLEAIRSELEANIVEYNQRSNGNQQLSKEQAISIRIEQNEKLADMLRRHRRHLLHVAGQPVEPEMHDSGTIHLLPAGGV